MIFFQENLTLLQENTRRNKENRIMILYDKGDPLYYDVSTDEQLYYISLKILKLRFESGNYYGFEESNKPQPPKISREEAKKIIDKDVKNYVLHRIEIYKIDLETFNKEKEFVNAIKKAVETKDGKLAYQILRKRRDAQYEGFEIKILDDIDIY
jgi:hypothetical protein